jgi:saccharopine dehydrogenase (NAD+, L-lysine-forming)
MDNVLIIGAGAAGSVVAKKCAMDRDTFKTITLASRRLESCVKVAKDCVTPIEIAQLDADDVAATTAFLKKVKPDLVINMALPYQDLPIMDACLAAGVNYLDTANYEPREVAKFEYSWQWAYQERFKAAGLTAILGCGFDPGVSNVWCAYAQEYLFDELQSGDQPAGSDAGRQILEGRRVDRHPGSQYQDDGGLSGSRPAQILPHLS